MKIIDSFYEIIDPVNEDAALEKIAGCGRVCYKSEKDYEREDAIRFVQKLIASGHESVLEHYSFSVKFITDRGVSHEIVRHRIASYSQESTRYCNYAKDKFSNEITVVRPNSLPPGDASYVWNEAMEVAEMAYLRLISIGISPETARSVLPTCLKTEIVVTMNIREWRHFFKLRTSRRAHPEIRALARDLLEEMKILLPAFFEDIQVDE